MISFIAALLLLILGYVFYGKVVEKNFGPDDRETPAVRRNDGVDYVPMPLWKLFLIQLLNIAGTGPIFGALSGALFGPVVYFWIVFGCIFAGSVHDYMMGMLSERHDGVSMAEVVGIYLGNGVRSILRIIMVVLLIMCGVVFTTGPAGLLALLTPGKLDVTFWSVVVFLYYFIATFVPIDKIIGKLYPLFGICLIVMAVGVGGSLLAGGNFVMPEVWQNFENQHAQGTHIWPFLFITVACGAISGFHATQSPLMARCMTSEREGRKVFYGAMIAEGIIALIWAAAGVTCYDSSRALLDAGAGCSAVVYEVCRTTMGKIGSILALLGVIICPISSGDTAYRGARLGLADCLHMDQSDLRKRLLLTVPILGAGALVSRLDYSIVWRYFSWTNQTLAMAGLWAMTVYLRGEGRNWKITGIPAVFMTAVTVTYFAAATECLGILWRVLGIGERVYYPIAVAVGLLTAAGFFVKFIRAGRREL